MNHMRDVKQARVSARVLMFLHHAKWIKKRHVKTGKSAHFGTGIDVGLVQGSLFHFRFQTRQRHTPAYAGMPPLSLA